MARTPKFKVIPNPELMEASRAFMPEFGNDEDLHIMNQALALDKKLRTVDNAILRGNDPKKLTTKMKQILQEERYLLSAITRRNLDF